MRERVEEWAGRADRGDMLEVGESLICEEGIFQFLVK